MMNLTKAIIVSRRGMIFRWGKKIRLLRTVLSLRITKDCCPKNLSIRGQMSEY